jgi:hypothetical protein
MAAIRQVPCVVVSNSVKSVCHTRLRRPGGAQKV